MGMQWVHVRSLLHTAAALSQVYMAEVLYGTLAVSLVVSPGGYSFTRLTIMTAYFPAAQPTSTPPAPT